MLGRIASSSYPISRRKSQPSPNTRSKRARFSRKYNDSETSTSDEESTDDAFSDGSEEYSLGPQPKRTRLTTNRSATTNSIPRSTRASKSKAEAVMVTIKAPQSTEKRPRKSMPWQTLPYELLLQIFQYASYPLCDERFTASPSVQWLLQLSLLCKSFTEPALSALYYAPPLSPPSRAHGLLAHLQSQSSSSMINYRAKIKYLDLEATNTLAKKHNGHAPLELGDLVELVPQLRGIGIHLIADRPQYKREMLIINRVKKIYRESLFTALVAHGIRLQTFKWNFFFNRDQWPWCSLAEIHSTAPFQTLHTLELVQLNTFTKNAKKLEQADELIKAIERLPKLKSLSFTLCTFDAKLDILNRLPKSLESLVFSDCEDITSTIMTKFLSTHGGNLRNLTLNHNRCLDLAFLVDFAIACPKLEKFHMDLTFFGLQLTYLDSEPRFEAILPPGAIPTWPSTLQSIELNHLRKWHTDEAKSFFQSLVDSAEYFSSLRSLVIKASVDMGWRDRVEFRNTWVERLTKIFARRPSGQGQFAKPTLTTHNGKITGRVNKATVAINRTVPKTLLKDDGSSDSDIPILQNRRNRRLVNSNTEKNSCVDSTRSTTARRQADSRKEKKEEPYIHGLCDLVDIRIDNLRPMETMYQETDFMDDEPSGDEDWDGEDLEIPGSSRHAW